MQTEAGKSMVQNMVASAAKKVNSNITSPPKEKEPELLQFPSRTSLVAPNFEKPKPLAAGTNLCGKTTNSTNVLRKRDYNQAFNQVKFFNDNEKMNETVSYLNNWPIHDDTNKENQEGNNYGKPPVDFFNTESNFKPNDSISKPNIFDARQEIKREILHRSEDNSSCLYVDYNPNSDNQGEPEISFNFTFDNLNNEIKSMPTVHNNINGIVNINDVNNVSINIDFSNLVLNTQTNEVVKGKKCDIPSDLEIDARLQAELDSLLPTMTSEESEIDARLQAELDSLPFIEVDNTEDYKELDDFMKSLFVYEGRPEVVEEVPTTASAIEGPQTQIRVPLGSDPQNCAQISYGAVENEVPVDEMQVPHNDADLDNPIFFPLEGAPNTDFLQPI
ncbi:uncharacterized protein LOC124462070 [Drosophila willistoni]|uniref:uncharacterized protein LOC124462070 n=1 Tax=Drosophila willistoni TaxID=7260 RepID=UPI001F084070|nr:uncharacterized protein LOC124462070 [Drosophila willistoni]XP_046869424.1 uncharacterized protein LOC124462070 [Drosophila willistoni]